MLDALLELATGFVDLGDGGRRRLRRNRRRLAAGREVTLPAYLLPADGPARKGELRLAAGEVRWEGAALRPGPVGVRMTSRAERRRGVPFLHRVLTFPGGTTIAVRETDAGLFGGRVPRS
jgi:hypothetical protein